MRIIVCKNYDEVSRTTAQMVADLVNEKPDLVFCLPAGASPVGMFKCLVEMYKEGKVDFSQMRTFDMDEYAYMEDTDPHSFAYFMRQHFLDHVNVKPENIDYPHVASGDIDAECRRYAQAIVDAGGLDIAITGIGDDGHIAFNEPGPYLLPRTHAVKLDEATRKQNAKYFEDRPEGAPTVAITTGMEEHMKARNYFVVCSGLRKAPLLKHLFETDKLDPMYPVSWLRMHSNCTFIIDEEAASQLPQEVLEYYK